MTTYEVIVSEMLRRAKEMGRETGEEDAEWYVLSENPNPATLRDALTAESGPLWEDLPWLDYLNQEWADGYDTEEVIYSVGGDPEDMSEETATAIMNAYTEAHDQAVIEALKVWMNSAIRAE